MLARTNLATAKTTKSPENARCRHHGAHGRGPHRIDCNPRYDRNRTAS